MSKGDLKIKKRKGTEETITFDPRLSSDKKTFVLVAESSCPTGWVDYLHLVMGWAHQEISDLKLDDNQVTH
jgi:hypothetical protein